MRIRPARPADLPVLQQIEVQAGRLFIDAGLPDIAAHDPPSVEELAGSAALLVAEDDVELIGYARVELVGDHAHLEQLSVVPHRGRAGVGTALLEAVVDWARARGDQAVTLTTFRDVPFNAPLYARRGFTEVPADALSDDLRVLVAAEAAHGLDPATRVVMRRPTA